MSAECPKRKKKVTQIALHRQGHLAEVMNKCNLRNFSCMIYNPNCIDENIRLLCSSKTKDRPQAEKADENPILDEIKQEFTMKKLVGKPILKRKLVSIANNLILVKRLNI